MRLPMKSTTAREKDWGGVRSPLAVYRELLVNGPQHSTLIH